MAVPRIAPRLLVHHMARTYGAASTDRDDGVGEHDNAPLLGNAPPKIVEAELEDGHATIASCVGNLANTIIGSGMLTFPLASLSVPFPVMASGGIIPGALTCITSGCIGALGLWMLSRCATRTPHRRSSFFAVSKITFPAAAVFFDAAIAIKCFGVSISYLIIIKGLMPKVVHSFYHVFTAPDVNPPWWAVSGHVWIFIFLAFLAPLCFLHRLDSLRHTSYVALFSVFYLVGVVIVCYFFPPKGIIERGEVHLVHIDKSFISTFPVQVFAFTCAQNLFPLYNEIRSNTQARMNLVIFTSIFSAVGTYEIIALFGYLTFGSKVGPNIIAMYPSTTLFIAIGQFAIVIMVMFSYPLQVHPCRGCLDKVFYGGHKHTEPAQETDEDEDEALAEAMDPHGAHGQMTMARHVALTVGIVGCGFAIAYFVDDLQLVLSFVGSTGSTTISFILPGLFYFKLFRNDPGHSRVLLGAALALALYGALIFVFWQVCLTNHFFPMLMEPYSLTFNIMKVIDAHRAL